MIYAPDEYLVIRPLDRAIQWFHDWGVERRSIMRAVGMTAACAQTIGIYKGGWVSAVLAAILALVSLWLIYVDEDQSKRKTFNLRQITMRENVFSWFRCYAMVLLVAVSVPYGLLGFDGYAWALLIWASHTMAPMGPPKHHWRELFRKTVGAMT